MKGFDIYYPYCVCNLELFFHISKKNFKFFTIFVQFRHAKDYMNNLEIN